LELKKFLSISSLIPLLKKKTPRRNKDQPPTAPSHSTSRTQPARHHRPLQCRTRTPHELGSVGRG
jgi:hypothetical protein